MKQMVLLSAALFAGACAPDVWEPERLAHGAGTPQEDVLRRGRESYETYCVGCHGANGDGNGPAARFLDPKPRDLRVGRVKFASVAAGSPPRDEDLLRTITRGLAGTSMPAWDLVPLDEATAIVAYVRTFSDAWHETPAQPVPIPEDPFRKRPERGVEEGEAVYHGIAACSSCHPAYAPRAKIIEHMKAAGIPFSGFRADMYRSVPKDSSWGAPITPPDFLVQRPKSGSTRQDLVRVIAAGVGGTAMPSWGSSLTPRQLWGLAYYVESLLHKRGTPEAAAIRRELDSQPLPPDEGGAKCDAAAPFVPLAAKKTPEEPLVDRWVVKAHLVAGFTFFFAAIFAGMFYALQFSRLYPFPGVELLSPGRVRMVHTNAVAYGFLMNCFIAALYWIVPRLTGHRVLSRTLSRVVFVAWQLIVGAAAIGIIGGKAQAIEWGETPTFVDPFVLLGGALLVANVGTPILKVRARKLYVSLWYFSAMLVWLPLTYAMGNFIPQYFVPGAGGAAVTGLYIHDLVGLTVTPLGWGMMYYFVPILLKRPIWSHTLSLVGFWGLAFFYPLNGVHHFFFSPIPMYAQYGAVMSTIAVEIVVLSVVTNFFMTLRGRTGDVMRTNLPLRWFYTGAVLYFVTCLQCAFQTTLTFQKLIHFTDWVVGHAHLVMFGVFSFWILGMVTYLWPKVVGARGWYSERINHWVYWLMAGSVVIMFLDLLVAGVVQGYLWQNLAPWERSITASVPFWHVRAVTGVGVVAGLMLQVYNMWMTSLGRVSSRAPSPAVPEGAAALAG